AQGVNVILKQFQHIHEEASTAHSHGDNTSILRLGCSEFIAAGLLPPVIARLAQRDPQILIRITESNVPHLFEKLIAGDLDALVCLYSSAIMTSAEASEFQFEKLCEEPYVVIAPAGHPLESQRNITWQALAQERWVITRKPSFARIRVE